MKKIVSFVMVAAMALSLSAFAPMPTKKVAQKAMSRFEQKVPVAPAAQSVRLATPQARKTMAAVTALQTKKQQPQVKHVAKKNVVRKAVNEITPERALKIKALADNATGDIEITGLKYAKAYYYEGYWDFDFYNDYNYEEYYYIYPDVYFSANEEATSKTSIVGTYTAYYAGYWTSANDSVEADYENPVGTLTITNVEQGIYNFVGSFVGTDGKTYTWNVQNVEVYAYDGETYEDIVLTDGSDGPTPPTPGEPIYTTINHPMVMDSITDFGWVYVSGQNEDYSLGIQVNTDHKYGEFTNDDIEMEYTQMIDWAAYDYVDIESVPSVVIAQVEDTLRFTVTIKATSGQVYVVTMNDFVTQPTGEETYIDIVLPKVYDKTENEGWFQTMGYDVTGEYYTSICVNTTNMFGTFADADMDWEYTGIYVGETAVQLIESSIAVSVYNVADTVVYRAEVLDVDGMKWIITMKDFVPTPTEIIDLVTVEAEGEFSAEYGDYYATGVTADGDEIAFDIYMDQLASGTFTLADVETYYSGIMLADGTLVEFYSADITLTVDGGNVLIEAVIIGRDMKQYNITMEMANNNVAIFDFSNPTSLGITPPEPYSYTQLDGESYTVGDVTIAFPADATGSGCRVYSNNKYTLRIYQPNMFTISSNGANIKRIQMDFDDKGDLTPSVGTIDGTGAWIGDAASISFSIPEKGTSARIRTITVYIGEAPVIVIDTFNVAQMNAMIDAAPNKKLTKKACVIGRVTGIDNSGAAQYGNINVWLSDINNTTDTIEAYRMKSFNGETYKDEEDIQFGIGDTIIFYADEWSYYVPNDMKEGVNGYLVKVVGPGHPKPIVYEEVSVAEALEIAQSLAPESGKSAKTAVKYDVRGYVASLDYRTYYLSDDPKATNGEFQAYKCEVADDDTVEVGSFVSVTGYISNYNGGTYNSYEINQGKIKVVEAPIPPISTIPTVQDLVSAGYDVANARVICLYFDEQVCNDIVWVGTYKQVPKTDGTGYDWSTDVEELSKFESLEGFAGWYVVEYEDTTTNSQGKPVQLKMDGSFAWDFQSGDVEAWINMAQPGTQTGSFEPGYFGEADCTWPENGAYIYEVAYFKNHNTPCAVKPVHDYTITAYLPEFCDEIADYADSVQVMGGFDGWTNGVWMERKVDKDSNDYWCAELKDVEEGTEFILRCSTDWSILPQLNGQDLANEILGENTAIVLHYNGEGYGFKDCAIPHDYDIYLTVPDMCQDITPAIVGDATPGGWDAGTPMSWGSGNTYYIKLKSARGQYKFYDLNFGWENEIQMLNAETGEWSGIPILVLGDETTVNIDYSNHVTYRWTMCEVIAFVTCNAENGKIDGAGKYRKGDTCTLTVTPNYGYHFVQWNDNVTDNPRVFVVAQDTSFTAKIDINQYQLTAQSADSTKGSVTGGGTYDYQSLLTITATANYGYRFLKWDDGNIANPRKLTLTQDTTFIALFTPESYQVTVQNANPAMGSVLGSGSYPYLSAQTISATANYGYHFNQWNDSVTDNPRTIQVLGDTIFTAEFAKNQYLISVEAEHGVISGGGYYEYQSYAQLTATADEHYHFEKWSDGNMDNPRTISVTEDKTYTAIFALDQYYVSAIADHGNISGIGTYNYGSEISLIVTPSYGYQFTQWNDGNTDNPRSFIVTQDTTFIAQLDIAYSGQCGDNLTWKYNDGVLVISGTDAMYDYTQGTAPWMLFFQDSISSLVINNGCTSIGNFAFDGLSNKNFKTIDIPNGVEQIGQFAFANCEYIKNVYLGLSLERISANAFANDERLLYITCFAIEPPLLDESAFANYDVYLSVPCESQADYKVAKGWKLFNKENVSCIGAEEKPITGDEVTVDPSADNATFTWPQNDQAAGYSIEITKDGVVFCTLTFNAQGQLTGIAFAPNRDGELRTMSNAEMTATGWSFTVTGLNPGSTYSYTVDVVDAQKQSIRQYTGSFTTTGGVVTSLPTLMSPSASGKILYNGHLYILRDGNLFTATGARVK
ncbi:MAG: leucine-rich repeat protein [Paludibacteraceae bacterium]|nr:leucine-rich repeat protein [Paludibacteraceae bacterium]